MSITIKDVARLSGVSISTVSRVINNSKPVSEDIRDRVLKVIEETKYVPNPVARSLVLRKSNFIGVIVPDISDYKMGELLNGIEEVGKMYNYDILLCNSYGEFEEEKRYIDLLKNKQVAGIIFVSWNLTTESIALIEESRIPSMYISKNAADFNVPSVGINHYNAGADAARYILSKKFKDICIVESKGKGITKDSEVVLGFASVLENEKKKFTKIEIDYSRDKIGESYQYMNRYIKSKKKLPEILFVTSDDAAVGVLNALLDNQIEVPKRVSVLGYDNSKISDVVRPRLSTVNQPLYDIGAVAIGVLIKQLEGEEVPNNVKEMPYTIIERESVK